MRLVEIFEDDDKQLSCYRVCFITGCVGVFGLAIAQFIGLGAIPIALYGIMATMASGGYVTGKYTDGRTTTITEEDATNGASDAP